MKKKIVFATGNKDKMREVREILGGEGTVILSMREAGIISDPDETGSTFEENALIKARAIRKRTDGIVMADDSGLEIDALPGELGVHSARFMGHNTPYYIKNEAILKKMKDVPDKDRTARFVCAIACILPGGGELTARGVMEGRIAHEIAGEEGFGYDPIFFLPEYGCTSAELTPEEKNRISLRGKALRKMKALLSEKSAGVVDYIGMNRAETNINGMRILIMSDTHGNQQNIRKAVSKVEPDEVWDLGDIIDNESYLQEVAKVPLRLVRGNCDVNTDLPYDRYFPFGRHRIMMTHGHRYMNADEDLMKKQAIAHGCDILLYGHTHIPVLKEDWGFQGVTIANPGSLAQPRQFGHQYTYLVLTISNRGEFLFNPCHL